MWKARRDGQLVAVKAFSDEQRLAPREFLALSLAATQGVVRVLDHGVEDGTAHVVSELVDGTPFPGAGADTAQIERRLSSLLASLGRVHDAGLVHRDLKPSNVLVEADGRVVLLDFGLARGAALGSTLTTGDGLVGTMRYLAPELLLGGAANPRSDLHAVGVMVCLPPASNSCAKSRNGAEGN